MQTLDFSWEPFYRELAHKLLEYKNNRDALVTIVKRSFYDNSISMPKMENGELFDIDPFTVLGIFNRQLLLEKRTLLATSLANYVGVIEAVPTKFDGVPILNNQNATFYCFVGERDDNDIDDLWNLFEYSIKYSEEQSQYNKEHFIKYFDLCVNKKGNGNGKITMALFWVNPSFYLNLDNRNAWYIYESNKLPKDFIDSLPEFKSNKKTNGNVYLEIVNKLHSFIADKSNGFNDFKELSDEAWRYANQVNEEIKEREKLEAKGDALADDNVDTVRYWIYSPGENSYKWDSYYKEGVMGIGWGAIGDLRLFETKNDMRLAITEKIDSSTSNKNAAHATWQFVHDLKPGDIIFVKKGTKKIIGRGVVESDYYYDDTIDDSYKNLRKVKWTHNGEWEHPSGQAVLKTLTDITSYTDYVIQLNELFINGIVEEAPIQTDLKEYNDKMFLDEVFITEKDYSNLKKILKLKKNVILQGAPGVGKTYTAKRLAYSLIGYKDLDKVQMVQFHQSYSYEDFIEGFRPGEGSFRLSKGIFYNFCKKAAEDMENDYYFIIDEINRGNLSKIFGELFMLIESDKRNNELPLLYSGDKFKVPSNVYIIGLMNTADRSLAMLDYALRRRFAFYTMKPGFKSKGFIKYKDALNNKKFNDLLFIVEQLNNDIFNDESLGEGFEIGHSYFCNYKSITDEIIYNIVEYELIPLLKEYWFDEPTKVRDWSIKLRGVL